ncbi:MAG TPA: oligosaccharide flippase family protein [Vicinamibacterales bacterium]|nr:oligosaccharide flippase family protein [Vicinamibacterales bacterium]
MLRNIGSTWVVTLAGIAATYVLTPFVIHTLGQEGYGVWTLIVSITGFISLLALGVPMACVRYVAQHVAERDATKINEAIGSCAGLYLILGAAAMLVGGLASGTLLAYYDLPPGLHAEARLAFGIMVLTVSAGFIGFLPEGIMFAHHDFVLRNVIRVSGILLRLALTLGLLALDASLVLLALVQLLCFAFDFGVAWLIIRRRYPAIRISLSDCNMPTIRRIFSFSVFVLLLHAGARLTFEADALVIGATLGVALIPFYAVANSLIVYVMEFIIAIAAVVSPMATKLSTEGRHPQLREMFLKWSKVALSLSLMVGVYLLVLGPRFLGWWIDPSFEAPSGRVLQILTISSLVFLPVRGVALPVLMGMGKPKLPTVAFVVAGILNVALSIVLAKPLGLTGVTLGTAIPNIAFAMVVLVAACRALEISVVHYLAYVVPRATAGAVPALAFLLWFRLGIGVETLTDMAVAGSAMVVLFGLTWIFFVYRKDPYVDVQGQLGRLRAWSKA